MLAFILNAYIKLFQDETQLVTTMYLNTDPAGLGEIDAFITCYYNEFTRNLLRRLGIAILTKACVTGTPV